MTFIETHCHLDYLEQLPLDEILSMSSQEGIEKIITIAVEPDNLDKVTEIASKYPQVFCTQGIHPHDAKLYSDEVEEKIISNTKKNSKVLAIGEIGLDYHYDNSPREIQKQVFSKQLEIATSLDKPVVIHTREADEDTIEILKNDSKSLKRKGVLHSFTSTAKLAQFALSEGFYIGFNGIITFKNAQEVRDIVEMTPVDRILFETDSPFLTPVPHRGKKNAPFYLPFVAKKIAEIKNIDLEELCHIVYKNSQELFQF